MARKLSLAGIALLVVVGGLLLAGQWSLHRSSQEVCGICARHINPKSGVIAEVGGRRRHVCCAHCAVTEGRQERKPVRLIEVTDYDSGDAINPATAWYVDGSRVIACEHDMTRMDEAKQPARLAFDRCSPGTFAFATRAAADAFAAKNGGVILSMQEMLAGLDAGEARHD